MKCETILHLIQTDQGIKNMSNEEAGEMSGKNPDYALQDLYDSIANGDFVSCSFMGFNVKYLS